MAAVSKLSQIAGATYPPAATDTIIGVQGGDADVQYEIGDMLMTLVDTPPSSNTSAGTPFQFALDSSGNLYVCWAANTWALFTNQAPFGGGGSGNFNALFAGIY